MSEKYVKLDDIIGKIEKESRLNDKYARMATNQDQLNSVLSTKSHLLFAEKLMEDLPTVELPQEVDGFNTEEWYEQYQSIIRKYRLMHDEYNKLKEQLPRWHDLRKNPADLPWGNQYVLVYDSEYGYQVARYLISYGYTTHWFNGRDEALEMVTRWMELPKEED